MALKDVQRLHDFLAVKSQEAAKQAIKAIRTNIRIIAAHPEIGRPASHMEPEYREWLISFGGSGYIALYRYDGQNTVILAVRHQKEVDY